MRKTTKYLVESQAAFRIPLGSTKSKASEKWKMTPLLQMYPQEMKKLNWMPGSLVIVKRENDGSVCGVCEIWPSRHVGRGRVRITDHLSSERTKYVNLCLSTSYDIPVASRIDLTCRLKHNDMSAETLRTSMLITSYVKSTLRRRCEYVVINITYILSVLGSSCLTTVKHAEKHDDDEGSSSSRGNQGLFRITKDTTIHVEWKDRVSKTTTTKTIVSDDSSAPPPIGGLKKELREVKEIVETPLHNPMLFEKHGVTPPRGVLMYGPPGTGKTLIARNVARSCKAKFIVVNASEIVGKFVGESEKMIRDVFEDAKSRRPAVIFFDEIDALCPSREEHSAGEFEKRLVSALLNEIDSMPSKVVILAATNRRHKLDPSLRRPGRIDREVEIPVPSRDGREDILRVLFRSMNQNPPERAIVEAADKTHGCVGADLRSLCRVAGLRALKRAMKMKDSEEEEEEDAVVSEEDIAAATSVTRPSALREITVEVPHVRWTDIGGQEDVKRLVKETIEWPLRHADAFQKMGIEPPRGVLLYGPPGCSKTLMAKALATESSMNFVAVKGPELFSKWVGESERAVQDIFAKARRSAPTIVFFDEIDALAVQRGAGGDSSGASVADRVLSQLLQEIDGVDPMRRVVIVAATNRPDVIDSALLRPGRIDRLLYVSPPNMKAREEILRIHLRKTPCDDTVNLNLIAKQTDGFSGAELAALCRESALLAMQECIDADAVSQSNFESALKAIRPQITDEMIQFYESYARTRPGL